MTKLQATGFNAFGQLNKVTTGKAGKDILTFSPLFPSDGVDEGDKSGDTNVFHTTWSTTTLLNGPQLRSLGHQQYSLNIDQGLGLHSPFGDHNGLIGCLDAEGRIYYIQQSAGKNTWSLNRDKSDEERPLLSHIALAGNGRAAITFKQAPNAKLTHVAEFASLADFRRWHRDPADEGNYPAAHHMVGSRPKQLVANAANFIMLMESGEVYTWGDPRFRTLARPTTGEGSVPASQAGIVDALGGLKISKIACGAGHGWLGAALSEDGAVYLWGVSLPGGEGEIGCLKEAGGGEVVLVELSDSGDSAEPEDVVDVGVGTNHAAVVTASGRLYVVGANKNGQLGLGSEQSFFPDWTGVPCVSGVQRCFSAPKATFVHTG